MPIFNFLVIALGAGLLTPRSESPLTGFWKLAAVRCSPELKPCGGSWVTEGRRLLAIDVHNNTVIIEQVVSQPLGGPHALGIDTLHVDGKVIAWTQRKSGFERRMTVADTAKNAKKTADMLRMYLGDSWRIAPDGASLLYENRDTTKPGEPLVRQWEYHRTTN